MVSNTSHLWAEPVRSVTVEPRHRLLLQLVRVLVLVRIFHRISPVRRQLQLNAEEGPAPLLLQRVVPEVPAVRRLARLR
jgi:hypothetical protein